MNEQLGEAVLKLALDVAEFNKGTKSTAAVFDDLVKRVDKVSNELIGLNKANEQVGKSAVNNAKDFNNYGESIKRAGQAALGFTGGMQMYAIIEKIRQSLIGNVQAFREYEVGLKEISTIVDTSVVDMNRLESGIDKVSRKWARGKDSLNGALYETVSANVAASDSIQFLDEAVKGSVGGLTDAKVAVDGLTSVMNAYGLTIDQIADVNDAFFVGVRDGKNKFEDLANGIGKVVPIASQVGMSYNDLIAVTASLTMSGLRTEEAFTGVRTILAAILKPSEDAKETAKLLGIEFDVNALKAKGFARFMEDLKEKTGGSQSALAKLFPDIQGLNAAMSVTSEQGGKNLNKVLSDMEKRMGEATTAANKMKDSLDFDLDKLGNNFKNLGLEIARRMVPAIRGVTKEINKQFETESDPLKLYDTDKGFRSIVDGNKALKEQLELRRIEAGEASKTLSFQKYAQAEKDKVDKKLEEEAKKAEERERKRVDDLLKSEETRKKNQEIAQKNADLLNKLESDRLAVAERLSGIESDRNSQILEDRRKAIEATAKYNKIAYNSQRDDLQSIVDDEKKSTEDRLAANQKLYTLKVDAAESAKNSELEAIGLAADAEKLEQEKRIDALQNYMEELNVQYKKSVDDVKNSNLENKADVLKNLEAENAARKKSLQFMIDNSGKAFDEIDRRAALSALNITEEFKDMLKADLKVKIGTDLEIDKDGFDQIRETMIGIKQTFFDIGEAYKELENVGDNATYSQVKIQVNKINQLMISAITQIQSTFSNFSGKYLSAILQDTRVAVSEVVGDVGDLISNIGEESGNVYLKVAGSVGKFFGNILSMAEKDEAKHEAIYKKQIAMLDQLSKGYDTTIEKTKEWLEQIGKIDNSNKSLSELKDTLQAIFKQGALAVGGATGISMTASEFEMYNSMVNKKGSGVAQYVIDQGGSYQDYVNKVNDYNKQGYGYDTFTQDEFALEAKRVNAAKKDGKAFDVVSGYASNATRQYSQQISDVQAQIYNYNQQAGLDYTRSKSKDDFLSDINTMREVGMISELQYFKDLYEYASGIKSHMYNAWEWFGVEDVKRYKKQYEDYLSSNSGSSGIIGLASGGIAMEPTYAKIAEAGVPEAVIPLDKLGSIMSSMYGGFGGGTIQVNLTVDPNIPITQNTARTLSEEFGQRIETVFRSRGI